jgi:hypothetical protein
MRGRRGRWLGAAGVSIALLLASFGYVLFRPRGDSPSSGSRASVGPPSVDPPTPPPVTSNVTSIAGTWEFASLTGVPPSLLPDGALPDSRDDIIIRGDGTFRWGRWTGYIEGSGGKFGMFVMRPANLRRRFEEYNASIGIVIVHGEMQVWLPDLGQDRDIDVGQSQEDIDSPDMLFRRV